MNHLREKLPQELWDQISSYLPSPLAFNGAHLVGFKVGAYDKAWAAVFRSDDELRWILEQGRIPVLIGNDLDSLGQTNDRPKCPHLVLAFHIAWQDGPRTCPSSVLSTLRGDISDFSESQLTLDHLTLTITDFSLPEYLSKDFRFLFGEQEPLETKYCYYGDPKKRISKIKTEDIRGINGPIEKARDLCPIFLLRLHTSGGVEQYVFREFGGLSVFGKLPPPLVEVIREEDNQDLIRTFRFKNREHDKLRHNKITDWIKLAEADHVSPYTGKKRECDKIVRFYEQDFNRDAVRRWTMRSAMP
jgi:hypothetical protein